MTTCPDLHRVARQLGVTLTRHDGGVKGGYNHDTRTISTRRGMSIQQYRSTLAHELGHAHYRDHPTVEGLVETGYLYPHEVETPGVNLVLPKATNRQLLEEINRRSDPEARRLFTNTDDHDVIDIDEDAEVFEFTPPTTPGVDQRPYDSGIPDDAVADSSPEVGGTPDDYER